jgi:hypothetical protein
LFELNAQIFGGIDRDKLKTIDIYIDLYSVLYPLYTSPYDPALDKDQYTIAAGIINMIAHYRQFYRKNGIHARIFLVYSNNYSVTKTKLVPEYNSDFQYKVEYSCNPIHLNILDNLQIVEQVCKYVNDVAFISSNTTDVSVLMYYLMNIESKEHYSIIVSKDIVVHQLCAIFPNTIIFRPKKYQGDNSFFISSVNGGLYNSLATAHKSKYVCDGKVSPGLYSFVLAATKVPVRSLKSLVSLPKLMTDLERVILLPDILNGYNGNILNICEKLDSKINVSLQHGNIIGRFRTLDVIYNYDFYITSPEAKLYKGIQNLYDPEGLHQIDTEYFKNWHLNLETM